MIRTATAGAVIFLLLAGNIYAAGNIEKGEDLAYDCITCHGIEGEGNFETPPIAGLDEEYILTQLKDFCKGKESLDGMMNLYMEDRTTQEMQDLAAYWASKEEPE